MTRSAALSDRQEKIRNRANELVSAGADRLQASYRALEEAWRTEALENERLWDQADEIEQARAQIALLRRECSSAIGCEVTYRHRATRLTEALREAHETFCGCDDPGNASKCIGDDFFIALVTEAEPV